MKRINSDKIYKYIPKNENDSELQSLKTNDVFPNKQNKPIRHNFNLKRRHQKNRIIYHNKNKTYQHTNNGKNIIYNKCTKCNKQILDELSSFYNEEKNEYYCFDCALNEAKNLLNPDPKNRIIYLGAGTFGEVKEIKSEKKFMIIKRIKFSKPKYEKFSMNYLPLDQY